MGLSKHPSDFAIAPVPDLKCNGPRRAVDDHKPRRPHKTVDRDSMPVV